MLDSQKNRTVTQKDVADRAGVSRSIVSYVINNGPRSVSPETRARVMEAIKELGYRPNKHAQMLSSTETIADKYLGIILASNYMFRRPYYGSILASMHEHAHARGWHIRFIRVFNDFNNPALLNELIHPDEIRGVILLGLDQVLATPDDRTLVEAIVERVERVVCVEWEWPGVPSIQFDRQAAAFQATQHLVASGRTAIAYIGPEDKRVSGFQQALWAKGIRADERLMTYAIDSFSGHACCEQLIASGLLLDAICAGTDEVAIGVLKSLHQHGLAVPGQVAVASIDNLDFAAYTIPALTSVDVPRRQIGLHTIDTLATDRPAGRPSTYVITVPTQLVIRESG